MVSKRKRYTDEFRASAVLMLEAAGYPDKEGALTTVSNRVNVPLSTLSRWYKGRNNAPPSKLVNKKRFDLIQAIRDEIQYAMGDMPDARPEASYRDLTTSVAILIDKLQLLEGKPTWRGELVELMQDGRVTIEQVREELGDELAAELFSEANINE